MLGAVVGDEPGKERDQEVNVLVGEVEFACVVGVEEGPRVEHPVGFDGVTDRGEQPLPVARMAVLFTP